MPFSKEIHGLWYGIEIPSWLRAFDCRISKDEEFYATTPEGRKLWGEDRAAADMNLLDKTTRPVGCSTYSDTRTSPETELSQYIQEMVEEATKLLNEWENAKLHQANKDEGGSCFYKPVAICINNFGWSILSNKESMVVRRFGDWADYHPRQHIYER